MNDMDGLKDAGEVLRYVYSALKAKGHDPIMQLVGYIVSGDPTYITNHNSARSLIRRVERDELVEELVRVYVETLEKRGK
ncbi:MAG: IreB family regulatory phosphoprotein [Clostridiales bacterium]|nr:IreB family regulatory phosphoprotein [Clostridiales bacterium]